MDLTSARFQRPIRWYWLAIVCGLIPMVLGSAVFAAWLETDSDSLEIVGIVAIYLGLPLFAVGVVALVVFTAAARKSEIAYRRSTAIALIILVANFPLCVVYVSLAFAMESAHLVTIDNGADVGVGELILSDPAGRQFPVGTVPPGEIRHACLDLAGEGVVRFAFTIDGETREGVLIGYLAAPLGSHATLRVSVERTVSASETFSRISLPGFLRYCLFG